MSDDKLNVLVTLVLKGHCGVDQRWGLSPSLRQKVGLGLIRVRAEPKRCVVGMGLELGRPSHSGDVGCSRTTNTVKQRHLVTPLSEGTAGFLSLYPLIQ